MRRREWPPPVTGFEGHRADYGVVGGSGFYGFSDDAVMVDIPTPYGPTSDRIALVNVGERSVAFMPRHGREHTIPAHRVNFRANLWALHSLGVRGIIAPCTVGSLRRDIAPGDMVVLDNLIDRTWGRADTYFDGDDGVVNHVTFAHPYDERLRGVAIDACRAEGIPTHETGTVVVVNGPRFSTRDESRWFTSIGGSVVNMTQYPEAVLAAELAVPFVGIALVTDYDAGLEGIEDRPVTMEQVLAVMKANVDAFRRVVHRIVQS